MASTAVVTPLAFPSTSDIDFGAEVSGVDIESLTDADFDIIRPALFTHQVLVFKNQSHVSPRAQFELTRRFDPTCEIYGHGRDHDKDKGAGRSILHKSLRTIPHQEQVQVIGSGFVPEFEGLTDLRLEHPHHATFHRTRVPASEDRDFTRFYRWHIDAALYDGLAPSVVTTLLAVRVPRGRRQTCRYDDGSGDELVVAQGATAFVSGAAMYDRLSEEEKKFARTTRVEYAPYPYVWMSQARSRPDGLGLESEGRELPLSELPAVVESRIQILPMCWRNPVTGRLHLQVHPSAVRRLHLANGTVVDDLAQARGIVLALQRPAIAPSRVYAHDWEEGDLVLFHNRGVIHSVLGSFAEDEVRLFRQCNLAASSLPEGPEPESQSAIG